MPKTYTTDEVEEFVKQVQRNITIFDKAIDGHVGNDIVLVVGKTGAGKSLVMNILGGKDVEMTTLPGRAKDKVIDVKDQDYAGTIAARGFDRMKIGHTGDSCTTFPNYIIVAGKQFWDCPGFGDTRSPAIEISNMHFIHKILETATAGGHGRVKFVVVQDANGVGLEKGRSFKDVIETMCQICGPRSREDFIKLIDATTFVFNKVPKGEFVDYSAMPHQYLQDTLAKVTISEEAAASGLAPQHMHFLQEMSRMHEADHNRIKHVELVKASRLTAPADIERLFVKPITDEISGVIAKVNDEKLSMQSFIPSFAISEEVEVVLKELQRVFQNELYTKCARELTGLVGLIFQAMSSPDDENKKVKTTIKSLLKVLRGDSDVTITDGGATKVSMKLIEELESYTELSVPRYKELLGEIKHILELMKYFGDITHNQICGADFTIITESVRKAAIDYADAADIKMWEQNTMKLHHDISEYNQKWWGAAGMNVVSIIPATLGGVFILGGALTLDPLAVAGGVGLAVLADKMHTKLPEKPQIHDNLKMMDELDLAGKDSADHVSDN